MILIADSGSSRTEWWLLDKGRAVEKVQTVGLNPYFFHGNDLADLLAREVPNSLRSAGIHKVFFYGAGCADPANQRRVEQALRPIFPGQPVLYVERDILGAARALFGSQNGLACVLGTGSNACLYDGSGIVHEIASLGYLLGDEGSGAHLGKTLIRDFLKHTLPAEIQRGLQEEFGLERADLLERIYRREHPNRFLASFSPFIYRRMGHPYITQLLENSFGDFFREQVCRLPDYRDFPLGCIGSVGYHFREVVSGVAGKYGIHRTKFQVSPLEGLTAYHS